MWYSASEMQPESLLLCLHLHSEFLIQSKTMQLTSKNHERWHYQTLNIQDGCTHKYYKLICVIMEFEGNIFAYMDTCVIYLSLQNYIDMLHHFTI